MKWISSLHVIIWSFSLQQLSQSCSWYLAVTWNGGLIKQSVKQKRQHFFFTKRIDFIKHCKSFSIINRWTAHQDSTSKKHSQKTPKLSDHKPTANFPWFRATCPNLHWLKNPTTYGVCCGVQGLGRWEFDYQDWGGDIKDNIYPFTKNRC